MNVITFERAAALQKRAKRTIDIIHDLENKNVGINFWLSGAHTGEFLIDEFLRADLLLAAKDHLQKIEAEFSIL